MSWNSLMCLDCLNFKSLSWKVCDSKPNSWTFDFIKISTHIINKIFKSLAIFIFLKNNAKMVKVLKYWIQDSSWIQLMSSS